MQQNYFAPMSGPATGVRNWHSGPDLPNIWRSGPDAPPGGYIQARISLPDLPPSTPRGNLNTDIPAQVRTAIARALAGLGGINRMML